MFSNVFYAGLNKLGPNCSLRRETDQIIKSLLGLLCQTFWQLFLQQIHS